MSDRSVASGTAWNCHPRNLAHTDSKAVTPISPAAQKFHLLILCNLLDNSVTLAASSMPGFILGRCHIADVNQQAAEIDPVISAAVSMSDFIIRLSSFRKDGDRIANPDYLIVLDGLDQAWHLLTRTSAHGTSGSMRPGFGLRQVKFRHVGAAQ
jgi:hypothetical protein